MSSGWAMPWVKKRSTPDKWAVLASDPDAKRTIEIAVVEELGLGVWEARCKMAREQFRDLEAAIAWAEKKLQEP